MSNCPFCNFDPATTTEGPGKDTRKSPTGFLRRIWRGIQWLFPAAGMALIPKCPMCVAAYVALFTGVGISVAAAQWIQILMWAICLALLAYLVVRQWKSTTGGKLRGHR